MASIRIGFSSDFVLKNGVVGLGTTVGSTTDGKLELDNGALRANLSVSGVATLTAYGGFIAQKQHVNNPAAIGFGTVGVGTYQQYYETTTEFTDLGGVHHGDDQRFNTLSEDLVIDDGQILNITNTDMVGVTTIGEYDPHSHSSYVCAGSLEQVSVTGHFSVPNGGSNNRQSFIEGTVRFNTDLNTLEFFNGNEWRQFTYNQGQSGRGVIMGGMDPANLKNIDLINIPTLGNATNFGDLLAAGYIGTTVSSRTRGIYGGRYPAKTPASINEYFTIASEGNSIYFGDLHVNGAYGKGAASDSTRGLKAGYYNNNNAIEYITMATLGNGQDFGDLSEGRAYAAGMNNGIRGIFAGGFDGTGNQLSKKIIDVVTVQSLGDAVSFGDLTRACIPLESAVSSSTRGVCGSGEQYNGPGNVNRTQLFMDYITLASEGNATEFGQIENLEGAGASTLTRGLFCGGVLGGPGGQSIVNTISFITIPTTGGAVDFGDLTRKSLYNSGCSDSHGGLGGF